MLFTCNLFSLDNGLNELLNSGNEFFRLRKYDSAIEIYKNILEKKDDIANVHFNLGYTYQILGNINSAIIEYNKAIDINPNYSKVYFQKAKILTQLGDIEGAIENYELTIKYEDDLFEAYFNLARIYHERQLLDKALEMYIEATKLQSNNSLVWLELGNVFNNLGQTSEAISSYLEALRFNPTVSSIYINIGYTLKRENRYFEAVNVYKKLIELNPEMPEAHFGLAEAYIGLGDLYNGFLEYEWRFKYSGKEGLKSLIDEQFKLRHALKNGADLTEKIVFLRAEAGFGDTIQFFRYAEFLKKRGLYIIACVQKPLEKLLSNSPYIDEFIQLGNGFPKFDYQASFMSLPRIFETQLETVPANIPYVYANSELILYWKEKLQEDKNFKVGICWNSSDVYQNKHPLAKRSIDPVLLNFLSGIENVSFYSLQKIEDPKELDNLPKDFNLILFDLDFDKTHGRFMDTAALIKNLDLVISVDTAVAHLAGALGAEVWMILPFSAEWRWQIGRPNTPWYPRMRLFRQANPGDWESVMSNISKELKKNKN